MTEGDSDPTLVEVDTGLIKGSREGEFLAWRGIPFAEQPTGPFRFRAPQAPKPWEGTLEASTFGPSPIQKTAGAVLAAIGPMAREGTTGEDCLTVNVLRQAHGSTGLRPVMVFIYGGGYAMGTSSTPTYGGHELVRRGDVVYVTFNYRLGVFGYVDFTDFATEDDPIESNLGLRDQVAALEWVQRNISRFGGDPDNVTIFGESAGAMSVTTLLTVPAAAGLFHRAIAQSSAPATVNSRGFAARLANRLVKSLGATDANAAKVLRRMPATELQDVAERTFADVPKRTPGAVAHACVVDGDFLPDHPINTFMMGKSHPVPLVIGTNEREGSFFAMVPGTFLPTTSELIDKMFAINNPDARERIVNCYSGYPSRQSAISICGDALFWYPSIQVAEGHSQVAPVWMYRYDHVTPLLRLLNLGATHMVELAAVFGPSAAGVPKVLIILGGKRSLAAVSDRVQKTWLSFATLNKATPPWPRYTPERRTTLAINTHDKLIDDPQKERRFAWSTYAQLD